MFVTVKFMTQSGLGVKIFLRIRSSPLHFTSPVQLRICLTTLVSPLLRDLRKHDRSGGRLEASSFCKAHIDTSGSCKRKMLGAAGRRTTPFRAHFLNRILPTHSSEEPVFRSGMPAARSSKARA